MRMESFDADLGSVKTFRVEISKREACKEKKRMFIDNHTIYVYTPIMIVFEKLRAICQQMPEYCNLVGKTHGSPRARDFFDIYATMKHFKIEITSQENITLLKEIFNAKKTPLELIGKIQNFREFHRSDFAQVKDTVKPGMIFHEFDYYFDYVVDKSNSLIKALRIE